MNNITISNFILAPLVAMVALSLFGWSDAMTSGLLMLMMFIFSVFALYRIHQDDARQWFQYAMGFIILIFWGFAFAPGEESNVMLFLVIPYLIAVLWTALRIRKLAYYDQY